MSHLALLLKLSSHWTRYKAALTMLKLVIDRRCHACLQVLHNAGSYSNAHGGPRSEA